LKNFFSQSSLGSDRRLADIPGNRHITGGAQKRYYGGASSETDLGMELTRTVHVGGYVFGRPEIRRVSILYFLCRCHDVMRLQKYQVRMIFLHKTYYQ
jgi:hypothetical protein